VACEAVLRVVGPAFCARPAVAALVGAAWKGRAQTGATVGCAQRFGRRADCAVAVGVVAVDAAANGVAHACLRLGAAGFAGHAARAVVTGGCIAASTPVVSKVSQIQQVVGYSQLTNSRHYDW
jgi:hypothetical protein